MYLALSWTPVRIDGKKGKVVVTSSIAPVMPGKNIILHKNLLVPLVLVPFPHETKKDFSKCV